MSLGFKFTNILIGRLDSQTVEDETLLSYDVNSLFTEIPLTETIDHILNLIYNQTPPNSPEANIQTPVSVMQRHQGIGF